MSPRRPRGRRERPAGAEPASLPRLDFNVVDEAVQLLDSDAEPWSIHLEVRVAGALDEARLRAAVAGALARHPMGRARRATSRLWDRGYRWEVTGSLDLDPVRVVDCADDAALGRARDAAQSLGVPLVESPPLRVRLIRHPGGDVVMLNVSHAATDGFGALRILRSIARAYAGEPDPVPDLDLASARNLQAGLAAGDGTSRSRRVYALLRKARDLVAAPARVAPDQGSDRPGYGLHPVTLTAAQTDALLGVRHRGTINDLLLAALHLAIAGWNAEHGTGCRRIGVMLPVNLRPPGWRDEVVSNFSLMATISTSARDRAGGALRAVTEQTGHMKRFGTGAALIEVLSLSPRVPLWVKQATAPLLWLTGNRLVDTAMLSNLGRMDELPSFGPDAGGTVGLLFSPPCRMPLGVAVGAVTAAGRLHLVFRYRHPLLSADAARRFADRYVSALGSLR
ncbi:MAG: hypothetical protein QOE72_1536 [Chloroflexota bacterium]|nr:hypothetical protein [Chloroflexota bacterium]